MLLVTICRLLLLVTIAGCCRWFQVIQEVQRQFDAVGLGVDQLPARRAWRDENLARLAGEMRISLDLLS